MHFFSFYPVECNSLDDPPFSLTCSYHGFAYIWIADFRLLRVTRWSQVGPVLGDRLVLCGLGTHCGESFKSQVL